MKSQKILVKTLPIVETLGSVNVICSDKTGTLTTNQMAVSMISIYNNEVSVGSVSQDKGGLEHSAGPLRIFNLVSVLCNRASFEVGDEPNPVALKRVRGDATDAALLRYAAMNIQVEQERECFQLLYYIPFSSKTKYMASVYQPKALDQQNPFGCGDNEALTVVKGAPEFLYRYCSHYLLPNESAPVEFGAEQQAVLEAMQQRWSSEGLRVLLLTYRRVGQEDLVAVSSEHGGELTDLVKNLCIVGLVGIMDPPRPETAGVVETCRKAGVRVFMVTGDNAATAASIATRVGIFSSSTIHTAADILGHPKPMETDDTHHYHDEEHHDLQDHHPLRPRLPFLRKSNKTEHDPQDDPMTDAGVLLTGLDLDKFQSHHWDLVERYKEVVFARTTPDQKFHIVKNLQRRHNIVAVTGDGVNDAPALKKAHIGVAMGGGSDAAIESAAMVLLDANFSSIVVALRQGRTVFENLKKVCLYLLPAGSFSELTPVLVNIFLGVPLPLSSFLMIVICVITDLFPALALMYESSEKDLLNRPPRRVGKDHLVTATLMIHAYLFVGILETIFAHLLFFIYMQREWGVGPGMLFLAFNKWGVDGVSFFFFLL